jgi:hypothetical protein
MTPRASERRPSKARGDELGRATHLADPDLTFRQRSDASPIRDRPCAVALEQQWQNSPDDFDWQSIASRTATQSRVRRLSRRSGSSCPAAVYVRPASMHREPAQSHEGHPRQRRELSRLRRLDVGKKVSRIVGP